MRRLIIDHVRNRLAIKRVGQFELTSLTTKIGDAISDDQELGEISKALDGLAHLDRWLSQIVDLKFLRIFVLRNCRHARCVRAYGPRKMGKALIYPHRSLQADLSR